jgi:hypothetical protein
LNFSREAAMDISQPQGGWILASESDSSWRDDGKESGNSNVLSGRIMMGQ